MLCFTEVRIFVCHQVPREKLRGVLRKFGVDGRRLPTVKSMYSCSEVCGRVVKLNYKSQPLIVGAGLRQGCVLSSIFFIVYISGFQTVAREGLQGVFFSLKNFGHFEMRHFIH